MQKQDFYHMIDDLIEAQPGTIKGDEDLGSLEGWDSLTVLQFIISIESRCGVTLSSKPISECVSVNDLMALLDGKIEP